MQWIPKCLRFNDFTNGSMKPVNFPKYNLVNPAEISLVCNLNRLEPRILRKVLSRYPRRLELAGNWDAPLDVAFEQLDIYEAFHAYFFKGIPWEETKFYARVVSSINNRQKKWRCSTEAKFLKRLRKDVTGLFNSIKSKGYKTQKELRTLKSGDEIRVAVDRYGQLMFVDGRHRLSIAKLLKLREIPVKIVLRHSELLKI